MTDAPAVRFSAVGLNHGHIYDQVSMLLRAGAELVSFYAAEPELASVFADRFPQARQARDVREVLEDETVQLVASAAIPNERAPLGVQAMRHNKDFLSDKPAFTTLDQLAEARRVQAETGRIFSVYYSERLGNPASVRAGELVQAGAIGQVVQTTGMGPHRINLPTRPAWFFQRERYGGILVDIAAHQTDQFLFYTGSTQAEVVASQVANYKYPQYPELEDFGEALLRSDCATGHIRVDWYTPDGLTVWGDGRLFLLGTEGYMEVRKYTDLAGRPGGSHVFWVDHQGEHYEDCSGGDMPFGRLLLQDIRDRTEKSMTQAHAFLASELAVTAQAKADRLGYLRPV